MRMVWFMPVGFLAGADGLVLLVPYVIFMAVVAGWSASRKQRQALALTRVQAPAMIPLGLELEAAAL